jgi:AcrR family transcriptional regulator
MRRRPGSEPVAGGRVARSGSRRPAGERAVARIASRGGLPREQVAEMQRSRLLVGAVGALEEHGYAGTTVARITARARVSRRTFYELFEDREACVAALIDDVLAQVEGELVRAGLEGLPWRERVRGGLVVILGFFDREPALARVCVVQALRSGPRVLERREATLTRLVEVLDAGRTQGGQRGGDCTVLTAEGLVGAALGIVHARLLRGDRGSLLGLVGELMGMIVLPYMGPAAARREQAKPAPSAPVSTLARMLPSEDPLQGLQMRWTYRTARVLQGICELPGASNRAVADYAGIQDQGQVSKLLARLQRLGLIANTSEGHAQGEPNIWSLTPLGEQVAQRLRARISAAGEQAA